MAPWGGEAQRLSTEETSRRKTTKGRSNDKDKNKAWPYGGDGSPAEPVGHVEGVGVAVAEREKAALGVRGAVLANGLADADAAGAHIAAAPGVVGAGVAEAAELAHVRDAAEGPRAERHRGVVVERRRADHARAGVGDARAGDAGELVRAWALVVDGRVEGARRARVDRLGADARRRAVERKLGRVAAWGARDVASIALVEIVDARQAHVGADNGGHRHKAKKDNRRAHPRKRRRKTYVNTTIEDQSKKKHEKAEERNEAFPRKKKRGSERRGNQTTVVDRGRCFSLCFFFDHLPIPKAMEEQICLVLLPTRRASAALFHRLPRCSSYLAPIPLCLSLFRCGEGLPLSLPPTSLSRRKRGKPRAHGRSDRPSR